jgi:hypothetical protein
MESFRNCTDYRRRNYHQEILTAAYIQIDLFSEVILKKEQRLLKPVKLILKNLLCIQAYSYS